MALSFEQHNTANVNERFHALDAVRACALMGGIVLHSITSFLPGFRDVNWPLADNSTSAGLGVLYFVIHLFRMSLFFMIAGFFARMLHQRLGTHGLITNRLRRIGLPLIAFYFLVMPPTVIAIIWGARQLGIQGPPKMESSLLVIGPPFPWGHLWFLYVLLIIYALTLILRACILRVDSNGNLRTAIADMLLLSIKTCSAPFIFAIPLAVSLFFAPWWNQWQGIPVPFIGLIPNFPSLLGYGSAFLVGWLLHRQQRGLHRLAKNWCIYLAGALIATTMSLRIVGLTPTFGVMQLDNLERASYVAAYTIALWCWLFTATGIAVRYITTINTTWRYVADASYWMYLIHLPIVWLLQAWMLSWPLHWSLKLALILGITSILLLVSYHYMVRSTFIGKFLNGRKYPGSTNGSRDIAQQ